MMKLTEEEQGIINSLRNGSRAILWPTNEFESKAQDLEEGGSLQFDREKFKIALDKMVDNHDCNHGICWDSIEFYLAVCCKLKEKL